MRFRIRNLERRDGRAIGDLDVELSEAEFDRLWSHMLEGRSALGLDDLLAAADATHDGSAERDPGCDISIRPTPDGYRVTSGQPVRGIPPKLKVVKP